MEKYFSRCFFWAAHSCLDPLVKATKNLKLNLKDMETYAPRRITNGLADSLNSKFERV